MSATTKLRIATLLRRWADRLNPPVYSVIGSSHEASTIYASSEGFVYAEPAQCYTTTTGFPTT
jgi:hypothetical protein